MSNRYIELPTSYPRDGEGWMTVYADIQKALIKSVKQVERQTRAASISSHDSIYVGNSGVAFMQYRLAELNFLSSSAKLSPEGRDILNPGSLRVQADHHLLIVLRQNRLPAVRDARHISFLETPVGLAALTIQRCLESLSRPRFSENENVLANLRGFWKGAVLLISGAVQCISSEDRIKAKVSGRTEEEEDRETNKWEDWGEMDEDGCEVLYGRAGFLYALLFLRKALDRAKRLASYKDEMEKSQREDVELITSDEFLEVVVKSLIARGKLGAKLYTQEREQCHTGKKKMFLPPLMWKWHGKRYLGAAHGVVGILQVLLSCPGHIVENHIMDILATVVWLLTVQDSEGNWPSKAPSVAEGTRQAARREENELVQWCHGASGVVILLSTVLRLESEVNASFKLPQELKALFISSLNRGAEVIYQRGLLRKGLGLCHGVAGSVFALLSVSNVLDSGQATSTGSSQYFKKAIHLAHLATHADEMVDKGAMNVPDRPYSLYEGMAGMCCAWGDIIHRLGHEGKEGRSGRSGGGYIPAFDDLL